MAEIILIAYGVIGLVPAVLFIRRNNVRGDDWADQLLLHMAAGCFAVIVVLIWPLILIGWAATLGRKSGRGDSDV